MREGVQNRTGGSIFVVSLTVSGSASLVPSYDVCFVSFSFPTTAFAWIYDFKHGVSLTIVKILGPKVCLIWMFFSS